MDWFGRKKDLVLLSWVTTLLRSLLYLSKSDFFCSFFSLTAQDSCSAREDCDEEAISYEVYTHSWFQEIGSANCSKCVHLTGNQQLLVSFLNQVIGPMPVSMCVSPDCPFLFLIFQVTFCLFEWVLPEVVEQKYDWGWLAWEAAKQLITYTKHPCANVKNWGQG